MKKEFPLFPLSMALFPMQTMELQIFEPRYLELVSQCLKTETGFGVVQIREGKEVGEVPLVFQFGVEAHIIDWTQRDNGLLGITIEGRRKFMVEQLSTRDNGLVVATVEWLPDEQIVSIPDRFDGLIDVCEQLRTHPAVVPLQLPEPTTSSQLGWQLCQLLPLSVADKVALLSMENPEKRLEQLAERVYRLSQG